MDRYAGKFVQCLCTVFNSVLHTLLNPINFICDLIASVLKLQILNQVS